MFCNYSIFPDRADFINTFSMRHDADNGLLHNAVQAMFVELTKLQEVVKKSVEQMTDMDRFAVFLKYAANPDYREIVNRVIDSREGLAVAGEVLMSISKDERERAIFRNRRIALADLESDRVTMEEIGRAKGHAEGRAKGRADVARNAIQMDMPIDAIIKLTGLTREEVKAIRDAD
jgi:predicted transposase/invertase (TIGR01784 family)